MTTCITHEGTVHTNYADTGRVDVNPVTGDEFGIWTCECGQDDLEVFPNT